MIVIHLQLKMNSETLVFFDKTSSRCLRLSFFFKRKTTLSRCSNNLRLFAVIPLQFPLLISYNLPSILLRTISGLLTFIDSDTIFKRAHCNPHPSDCFPTIRRIYFHIKYLEIGMKLNIEMRSFWVEISSIITTLFTQVNKQFLILLKYVTLLRGRRRWMLLEINYIFMKEPL